MILEIILGIIAALLVTRFFEKQEEAKLKESKTEEQFTLVENNSVILLQTETIDDMIYCYSAIDDQFICQGKSISELRSHFSIRFPEHNGVIAKFDDRAKQILLEEKM
jgi:exosome complex RNA-binding protein Rrp42 (RNase PH superfamily)